MKARREFFKRAALIGVPLALATVRAQTAWAGGKKGGGGVGGQQNENGSCTASVSTSGCK